MTRAHFFNMSPSFYYRMKRIMIHRNKTDNEYAKHFSITINFLPFGIGRKAKSRLYNRIYFISLTINWAKNTTDPKGPRYFQKSNSLIVGKTYITNKDYVAESVGRN